MRFNQNRLLIVYVAIMLFSGYIFFRLYTIAVSDFTVILPTLSYQHSRRINIVERRGFIFDRHGELIAGRPGLYNTVVDPSKIGLCYYMGDGSDAPETVYCAAERLAGISDMSAEYIARKLRAGVPFVMQTRERLRNSYAQSYMSYGRATDDNPAVHIIGYLNADRRGVAGIEAAYDELLERTGARVTAFFSADALNRSFRGEPMRKVYTGYGSRAGLSLTLDLELQRKVERIADEHLNRGAIVVADVATGEILASASRPVFSVDNLAAYIDSDGGEFINRAFSAFTPGSVFKTVVAAAALEMYPGYLEFVHDCAGHIDVGGVIFGCWVRWGHGELCMTEAYAHSCNAYFIALALKIGYAEIYAMASKLGIGEFNALDGLQASRGNMPAAASPPPAQTANAAIGQGELLMTPLEATRIFCAIANGGVMPELSLVRAFKFGHRTSELQAGGSRRVLSRRTAGYLQEMARAVVEFGTGMSAAPGAGIAAGKTSSAESGQFIYVKNEDGELEREQLVHSWFSGYYPAGPDCRPRFSVTVMAEGGVNDNVRSDAIFRAICDYLSAFLD